MSKQKALADVLREIGHPTQTSELVKIAAKEFGLSEPHVYKLLKKAWKDQTIRKITLPDRHVLCALPEWSLERDFQDAFYYFALKELEQIAALNISGRHMRAFHMLRHLRARQPLILQDKLHKAFKAAVKTIEKAIKTQPYDQKEEIIREVNLMLIGEFSLLLHEQLEKETP